MSRYAFIRDHGTPWPLGRVCRVLAVSSAYDAWKARPAPVAADWHPAAQAAFTRHAQRYGTRRLRAVLSQYTSATCRACIAKANAHPSYARVGNPYDNAQAEVG